EDNYIWELQVANEKLERKLEEKKEVVKFRESVYRDDIQNERKKYLKLYEKKHKLAIRCNILSHNIDEVLGIIDERIEINEERQKMRKRFYTEELEGDKDEEEEDKEETEEEEEEELRGSPIVLDGEIGQSSK
ncbi:21901_t:CDS:1, partial [Gigaspora margarita]